MRKVIQKKYLRKVTMRKIVQKKTAEGGLVEIEATQVLEKVYLHVFVDKKEIYRVQTTNTAIT